MGISCVSVVGRCWKQVYKAKYSQSMETEDQEGEMWWEVGVVWPDPGDQGCNLASGPRLTSPRCRLDKAGPLHGCGGIDRHTLAMGLPGTWVGTKPRSSQGCEISQTHGY